MGLLKLSSVKIGMAHSTFIRKMRLGVVSTTEAQKMAEVLNIEEPNKIFSLIINLTS